MTYLSKKPIENYHFIYKLLGFGVKLTLREKMYKFQLKLFLHDQTCVPINHYVLRMRVALMMCNRMNITKKLLSNKTLEICGMMEGKLAIAYHKYVINDF